MRNTLVPRTARELIWATPLVTALLWGAVVAFAVSGAVGINVHGDMGVFLIVAALIVAAPAAAASRLRTYL